MGGEKALLSLTSRVSIGTVEISSMGVTGKAELYEQAPNADGVFVPCPRWPTIADVDLLEREIGKPVVTSCQAYIWHAMRMAKVKETITGFGRHRDRL